MESAFQRIDVDSNGLIDANEFRVAMLEMGTSLEAEVWLIPAETSRWRLADISCPPHAGNHSTVLFCRQ